MSVNNHEKGGIAYEGQINETFDSNSNSGSVVLYSRL